MKANKTDEGMTDPLGEAIRGKVGKDILEELRARAVEDNAFYSKRKAENLELGGPYASSYFGNEIRRS